MPVKVVLHQLYLGAGFKIFKKSFCWCEYFVSLGDITHTRSQSFPSNSTVMPLTTVTGMEITSYKLDFGAQYTHQFSKKHVATLGVVFSPGHDLNNDAYVQNQKGNSSTGYTTTQKDTILTMGIPMTLGAGVTYVYDDRLYSGCGCYVSEME